MSAGAVATDLVVVGDASIDHYVQVPHLATSDNKAIGRYLGALGGGMSANLAAAAAAQGVKTRLITKIGGDPEANEALETLEALGVDTSYLVRAATHRTWMCFVQLDRTGEKALIGADTGIKVPQPTEIDARALHRSRIVAPLADDLAWATKIAQVAVDGGSKVAIDLEPDAFDPDDAALVHLLDLTNIVFLNSASAEKISEGNYHQAAKVIHGFGPKTVVVSRGQHGAYCSLADGQAFTAQGENPVHALDTTGAGDALAGTFLASILQGHSPAMSLKNAVARATACVTQIGSRTYLTEPSSPHLDKYHVPIERNR